MAGEGRRAGGLLETFQAEVVERVCETPGPRAKVPQCSGSSHAL
jgi:hypothetical protein